MTETVKSRYLVSLVLAAILAALLLVLAEPAWANPHAQNHEQDFSITKTANKARAAKGRLITYTLKVSNTTSVNSSAGGATVTDQLPAGLKFVAVTVTKQPQQSSPFACSGGGTITCSSPAFGPNFGGSDSAEIQIIAKKTVAGPVKNIATIQPNDGGIDTNPANNSSSVVVKKKS